MMFSRFGKSMDEVFTILFSLKQGTTPLPDYLDKIIEVTSYTSKIDEKFLLTVLKQNLNAEYA